MQGSNESAELSGAPKIESIQLTEVIGEGGMSTVYKGTQLHLDRVVAVKCLKLSINSEERIERFKQEAKISMLLKHPNIIETYSAGSTAEGVPYLVMEYVAGENLSTCFERKGVLQFKEFRDLFLALLDALQFAHEKGLVHRDIKASNILLPQGAESFSHAKIADFGLAKFLDEECAENVQLTKTGVIIGTPKYMSPEQCKHYPVDARSDIYSMSCIMFESLSGKAPFIGESSFETINLHCTAPLPRAEDWSKEFHIPKRLANAILTGLEKEPSARPSSAEEFSTLLRAVLDEITLDRIPSRAAKAGINKNLLTNTALAIFVLIGSFAACLSLVKSSKLTSSSNSVLEESRLDKALKEAYEAQSMAKRKSNSAAFKLLRSALDTSGSRSRGAYSLEESATYKKILQILVPVAQSIQVKSKVLVPTDALERNQALLKSDDPNRVDVLFLTGQLGAALYEYSWAQNEFYFAVDTAYSTKNFSSIPKIVRESNKYASRELRPLAALKVTQIQIIDAIVAKDNTRAKEFVRKARTQINEASFDPRDKVNLLVDLTPYEQLLFDDEEMESCIKEITTLCSHPISSHPFFSRVVHRNAIPILTSDINDKTLQNLRNKLIQKKWKNMVDPTLKEVQNWKTKGNSSSPSH